MKSFIAILVTSFIATVANAATVQVTPTIGYQFNNETSQESQVLNTNSSQNDSMIYGVAVTTKMGENAVGVQYLTTDTKHNSYQVEGVIKTSNQIVQGTYLLGSAGYYKFNGTQDQIESPVIGVGVGKEWTVNNQFSVNTETKVDYITNENYWNPKVLVGLNLNF